MGMFRAQLENYLSHLFWENIRNILRKIWVIFRKLWKICRKLKRNFRLNILGKY